MEERRREARTAIHQTITVEDEVYKEALGTLADISPRGLRVSGEPAEVGDEMRLSLVLPEPIFGKHSISVTALCVWCRQEEGTNQWLSGFEFSQVSREDTSLILGLILESQGV